MSRRTQAILLAGVITVLAFFGVAGHSRFSGPVLLRVTRDHGLHRDDLIVLALWFAGLWICFRSGKARSESERQPGLSPQDGSQEQAPS